MLKQLSQSQFLGLSTQSNRIVLSQEIYGDRLTPVGVFENLAQGKSDVVLLDSSDHGYADDACIYMGFDPVAEFHSLGQQITLFQEGKERQYTGDPFEELRQFYHQYKGVSTKTLAKFAGGMIGFMSYDAIRLIERIPDKHPNDDQIPDLCFKFYGTHVVFDKRTGRVTIAKLVDVKNNPATAYMQGMQEIENIISQLHKTKEQAVNFNSSHNTNDNVIETDLNDQEFGNIVNQAKHYISQGDAFQIVISRRFKQKYTGNDFDIYRALRLLNPSPYQFYIRNKDFTMVGSSPEKLVSLQNGIVEVTPIAGTRPRGGNSQEDEHLQKELLNDGKEMAEHMMLVDLGRNDVGSICEPGSVKVTELAKINKFSRVMHIISRVQGKLRAGLDAIDTIKAIFPAGTLSGAPKIRAMEIIDELEHSRRGIYGGGVCAIDNEGQMDSCITIRTALVKNNTATVRAGAGVVLDSDPQKEADETRRKAQAVLDALALAERGFV